MDTVVVKFGGTSLASQELRKEAISHISSLKGEGKNVIAVVSAMGRKGAPYATDTLISLLSRNCDPATLDLLMSCGEVISACVFADSLIREGIEAVPLSSLQAGIVTDGVFGSADIFDIDTKRMKMELYDNKVVVVTGFQGVTVRNDITTLGRGGSDTSAVVIGGFMNAESVHIFTDVPGIAVIDPRLVPKAKYLEQIDVDYMYELARWGAGVIHPRAVAAARNYDFDLFVRSTFDKGQGTRIIKDYKIKGPVAMAVMKDCAIFDAVKTDKLIIEGEKKKAVRPLPDSGYSLLTVVFGKYGKEEIREAIGALPAGTELFLNGLCAHIFVEAGKVESLANDLYERLFG